MGRPGAMVNIAGTTPVDDPEYRYRMPTVYGKIEGRGNGIKTVVPNILDVALSLKRDAGEVNKFFGCELGSQTTYNADSDRAIVNGAHTDAVLQQLVHKYIELFVLCPNCRLPETEYKIKSGCIYHKCMACGAKEMVDMSHKLTTYILAQDKKEKQDAKKAGKDKKKDKKEKKKDKKDDSGSDEDKKKEKKDKKKDKKDSKKDKKDKKKEKKSKDEDNYLENAVSGGKGDDYGDDDSDPTETVDDDNAMALAVAATKKFLLDNPDASPSAIAEKVVNEQMASGLKSQDRIHIFIRAAFTVDFFKQKQVEKHAPTISKITRGKTVMERHLISACEFLCAEKPKNFAVILKQLFDEEVLEEDTIFEWAGEGRTDYTLESVDEEHRAQMRAEAEPVVVWLQEDDSSDEDSD
mmetsp:Transcript_2128/g.4583  ORF Transcript_2128/g.4583 Transcript_2128/m.4583 type:complete len:408 (-) Transcript_2128:149-1372(-)|eukprot:CAMPEP_0171328838 /NCGR_PEP_ID=MMETSP0878-20121228/876_1 /TAXON_ID=67004 /ORGANISM="Thalassiosira weissflogii, Strain CCMP1336" /LENGTH=407 /DNA_ID=CAMNT_0011828719 /DNA_START=436 /DNA_END=1659 /DNA_ORIENTATION=+